MPVFKHQCENCDSKFAITYSEEECEADPSFCPMCAEPMFYDEEDLDYDE